MSQQPLLNTAPYASEVSQHSIEHSNTSPDSPSLPNALDPRLHHDAALISPATQASPETQASSAHSISPYSISATTPDALAPYPRLCQWLGLAGIASRRRALAMISQGEVKINGEIPSALQRVYPNDVVTLHGDRLTLARPQLWCYHKPVGIDCNLTPHNSASLWHVLQQFPTRLFPIGRLDKDSSGLLLLTNQGLLAQQWLHPALPHEKEYWVQLDKCPSSAALTHFANGVRWQVGPHHYQSRPCQVAPLAGIDIAQLNIAGLETAGLETAGLDAERPNNAGHPLSQRHRSELQLAHHYLATTPERWVAVVLTEGQHRQIRYMWRELGYRVCQLIRVRFNDVRLGDLATGACRELPLPMHGD